MFVIFVRLVLKDKELFYDKELKSKYYIDYICYVNSKFSMKYKLNNIYLN